MRPNMDKSGARDGDVFHFLALYEKPLSCILVIPDSQSCTEKNLVLDNRISLADMFGGPAARDQSVERDPPPTAHAYPPAMMQSFNYGHLTRNSDHARPTYVEEMTSDVCGLNEVLPAVDDRHGTYLSALLTH